MNCRLTLRKQSQSLNVRVWPFQRLTAEALPEDFLEGVCGITGEASLEVDVASTREKLGTLILAAMEFLPLKVR